MDYFGVLKRAWHITWRYKALWVLGLFAGAGSFGGNSGGSNISTGPSGDLGGEPFFPELETAMREVGYWFEANVVILIAMAAVLVLVGFIWWIVSIAATGGLVYAANEAAEDRRAPLGVAWGVGFRRWGRTFMTGLVVALPVLMVVLLLVGVVALVVLAAGTDSPASVFGALLGVCGAFVFVVILIIPLSVIMEIVFNLALRYGVLYDITFGRAIKQGWSDVWGKRGAFVMWLVALLPAIAYGIAALIIAAIGLVPAFLLLLAGQLVPAALIVVGLIIVMFVPAAVYSTFYSSTWTVFFRRMTGLEQPTERLAVSPPPPSVLPPAPPTSPLPPPPPAVAPGL